MLKITTDLAEINRLEAWRDELIAEAANQEVIPAPCVVRLKSGDSVSCRLLFIERNVGVEYGKSETTGWFVLNVLIHEHAATWINLQDVEAVEFA